MLKGILILHKKYNKIFSWCKFLEKKEVEDKNAKLLAENESLRANSPAKKGSESKQSVLNGIFNNDDQFLIFLFYYFIQKKNSVIFLFK